MRNFKKLFLYMFISNLYKYNGMKINHTITSTELNDDNMKRFVTEENFDLKLCKMNIDEIKNLLVYIINHDEIDPNYRIFAIKEIIRRLQNKNNIMSFIIQFIQEQLPTNVFLQKSIFTILYNNIVLITLYPGILNLCTLSMQYIDQNTEKNQLYSRVINLINKDQINIEIIFNFIKENILYIPDKEFIICDFINQINETNVDKIILFLIKEISKYTTTNIYIIIIQNINQYDSNMLLICEKILTRVIVDQSISDNVKKQIWNELMKKISNMESENALNMKQSIKKVLKNNENNNIKIFNLNNMDNSKYNLNNMDNSKYNFSNTKPNDSTSNNKNTNTEKNTNLESNNENTKILSINNNNNNPKKLMFILMILFIIIFGILKKKIL